MLSGIIVKALSGFYYVSTAEGVLECKARGRFRMDGTSPLVGDRVNCSVSSAGKGMIDSVLERRNWFIRPSVANVDALVFVAANTNPVTDPFLIDRVSVIAAEAGCRLVICINKSDIDPADELYSIFTKAGFTVVRTSALTGEGIDELKQVLCSMVCAFTGNSGVGKSSILNAIVPELRIETGEVSEKLGRGRHTTRHVELYDIGDDTFIADTPGFASFDLTQMKPISKTELQYTFPEFRPFIGQCRFDDCAHLKEPGCRILQAVREGEIDPSRHKSYQRLYEISAQYKQWENK